MRATMPSASRSVAASVVYDSSGTARASTQSSPATGTVRTRGRRTGTRRPPSVTLPASVPCRTAVRAASCLPFAPAIAVTSACINSAITSSPTAVDTGYSTLQGVPVSNGRDRAVSQWPELTVGWGGVGGAFVIVDQVVGDGGQDISCLAQTALAKVLGAMDGRQRQRTAELASRIWMRTPRKPGRNPVARGVDEGLRTGVVVNLDYEGRDGQPTRDRPVEPLAFARTEGRWYLLGWCRLRCGGRWFRLDRIQDARLTRQRFDGRDLREVFGPPPQDAHPVELPPA